MFGLVITAIALFFVYYTGARSGECKLHEFFISFNMVRKNIELCISLL